jgi:hypothetical protein
MNSVSADRGKGTSASLEPQSPLNPSAIEQRAGASRLLSRLYRDVGLAAVASELKLSARFMDRETAAAIDRGDALLRAGRSELAA